jgi:hypothetical protein
LLNVLGDEFYVALADVELGNLNNQFCKALIFFPQQVELDLSVVFLGVGLRCHPFEPILIKFSLATTN